MCRPAGLTLTTGFNRVTLQWGAVTGADQYLVGWGPTCDSITYYSGSNTTSYVVNRGDPAAEGARCFAVRAFARNSSAASDTVTQSGWFGPAELMSALSIIMN
jgi:hypothetical protein